jgi:hypothetical protein
MATIIITEHATLRLRERLNASATDLEAALREHRTVIVGNGAVGRHARLFFLDASRTFGVAIVSERSYERAVVTVLTLEQAACTPAFEKANNPEVLATAMRRSGYAPPANALAALLVRDRWHVHARYVTVNGCSRSTALGVLPDTVVTLTESSGHPTSEGEALLDGLLDVLRTDEPGLTLTSLWIRRTKKSAPVPLSSRSVPDEHHALALLRWRDGRST